MTQSLKALLDYQEVDMELRKIELECEQNDSFRQCNKARQLSISAKSRIEQCEKKAEDILGAMRRAQSEQDSVAKKVVELKADVEDSDADDDVEYIFGVLKRAQESAVNLERDVVDLQRQIQEVVRSYNEARKSMIDSKTLFDAQKEAYDKFYTAKKVDMDALKAKLSKMSKSIDAKLMEKYSALRKEKKMPAVQQILKDGTTYRCPRCRMEVDAATVDKIRTAEIGECDTCRFILYME